MLFFQGVKMTFFEPLGGLYRPLRIPFELLSSLSHVYPLFTYKSCKYHHLFPFSYLCLLFLRPFHKICLNFIFCEGKPSSSIVTIRLLTSLGQPIFSFLCYDVVLTSDQRGEKCRHLKSSQKTIIIYLIFSLTL